MQLYTYLYTQTHMKTYPQTYSHEDFSTNEHIAIINASPVTDADNEHNMFSKSTTHWAYATAWGL